MINLKQALLDPSSLFDSPQSVLVNDELTNQQKVEILKNWESDLRVIMVAEEENMQGKDVLKTFEGIRDALHSLGAIIHPEDTPPTKEGG